MSNRFATHRPLITSLLTLLLAGCATYPGWLPSDGPSREQVMNSNSKKSPRMTNIQLIDVNDDVTRQLLRDRHSALFSDTFGATHKLPYVIGPGDVIDVTIWEAPPAMLFGSMQASHAGAGTAQSITFPAQMVDNNGTIEIPFAGAIDCDNKTPEQIEREIANQLQGKAHQPQVLVRVVSNNTDNVTIVGEVNKSIRMPLTARGERLLDAIASAGGVRQSVSKMTIQLTRDEQVHDLPLDTIIRDPRQNIALQPGDVVTALYKPQSFTVFGATGKNQEINFEAQGISLTQALARAGGLQSNVADARAVFIFRLEDDTALHWTHPPQITPDGKVPVIYQVDLRDPASFFVAQNFPMDNKDVIYVSDAPAADLQKFLNIIVSVIYPLVNAGIVSPTTSNGTGLGL